MCRFFLLVILFALPNYVTANSGIVAVVDNNVISSIDLEERTKLAAFSSGLPLDKEVIKKITPQILKTLISEELYKQDAAQSNITASKAEIQNAIKTLEVKNKIKPGEFVTFLNKSGISYNALTEQIKAQIIWSKILSKKIRRLATISDSEIDEKINDITKSDEMEFNISEITLPINAFGKDSKTKELADKLTNSIKQGNDFTPIAKEFSHSTTAKSGGNIGWVKRSQLDKIYESQIDSPKSGKIFGPLKIGDNYSIVKINDVRKITYSADAKVGLKQTFLSTSSNIDKTSTIERIKHHREDVKTCDDFTKFAKSINSEISDEMILTNIDKLNKDIRHIIENLPVGILSDIVESSKGVHTFMICEKTRHFANDAYRRKLKNELTNKKVDVESKNYLMNLRRSAFIEIKI